MALFDSPDLSDPDSQAANGFLAGLANAFAQGGMPSRAPIPFGSVLGSAFGQANQGRMAAGMSAMDYQKAKLGLAEGNLSMAQTLAQINFFRQRNGMAPITLQDLAKGGFDLYGGGSNSTPSSSSTPTAAAPASPNLMPQPVQRADLPPITSPMFGGNPKLTVPSIANTESGGNENAVGSKGETSAMQVLPSTQASPGFGVKPATGQSDVDREAQDYYMALVKKYGGNQSRALVAYNMGPAATDKWIAAGADMKKLPTAVKQYVGSVALGTPVSNVPRFQDQSAGAPENETVEVDGQAPQAPGYNVNDDINTLGMFNPSGAISLMTKLMQPQNLRSGSQSLVIGLDGKPHVIGRNPNLGKDMDYDPNANGGKGAAFLVPGALDAEAQLESKTTGAKRSAELPYDLTEEQMKAIYGMRQNMGEAAFDNWVKTGGLGVGNPDGSIKSPGAPAPAAAATPVPQAPGAAASAPSAALAAPSLPANGSQPPAAAPPTQGNTAGIKSVIPAASEAPPINKSENYLDKAQPQWAAQEEEWNDELDSNITGEQRALAIADALKKTQSGAWAEDKADVAASLKAVGINVPDSVLGSPSEVQKVLKDNFQSTLAQIRAFTSRPAAIEVKLAQSNFANPDLQPEANLAIIAQTVGSLRWERAMMNDWQKVKNRPDANGNMWQNPQDFENAWAQQNPMQKYIDATQKEIGTLKGMPKPGSGMPPAVLKQLKAGTVTHFKNGQSWTLDENGQPKQVQ